MDSIEGLLEWLEENGEGGDRYHRRIRVWRQSAEDPEPGKKMITEPARS